LNEVKIDHSGTWKNDHWRAITSAYALAPYFDDYAIEVKEIIFANDMYLWEKNARCLRLMEAVLDKQFSIKIHRCVQGIRDQSKKRLFKT
jgi:hypothetical protein